VLPSLTQYKILDRIGSVENGDAYRARDLRHGRTVAIKVLNPASAADPLQRERFLSEARAATVLSHPNIAAVYEAGEENGVVFAALEFVPGEPLRTVVGGRPLNPRRAAEFTAQLADALAEAHAHGFCHGDLRAESVAITPKGNAKIVGFVVGSPAEAVEAPAGADGDIYRLGTLLFEMLTGKPPASRPDNAGSSIPPPFSAVVAKALNPDAAARYHAAAAFAADVREAAASLPQPGAAPQPVSAPVAASKAAPSKGKPSPAPAKPAAAMPAWAWALVGLGLLAALGWVTGAFGG
jgi:serine/threonine-protein kinase